MHKKSSLLAVIQIFSVLVIRAQVENSPYSRYGLGDKVPGMNILNRGMGGVSAAYSDFQSVNFINPASYSQLKLTTFDFGLEIDSRTIRSIDPPKKFNGVSPIISYVQIGIPLTKNWGMNFGLKPVTRINYSIDRRSSTSFDSLHTRFEGDGGTNEVFFGTGYKIGNFSLGANLGYLFGSKNYHTYTTILPDSINPFHYRSNHTNQVNFGGFVVNGGIQYNQKLGKTLSLQLGAYGNMQTEMKASEDVIVETFSETANGNVRIDSIFSRTDDEGKLQYPASYGAGMILKNGERWLLGVDYSAAKWSQYRLFNVQDNVQDSWKLSVGGQVIPNYLNPRSYWGRVAYRAGFSFGKDYVAADGDLDMFTFSLGLGLPMRRPNYSNQVSMINTSLEFGQRGNKENIVKENFFRLSFGLTLSDIWFQKRKYD